MAFEGGDYDFGRHKIHGVIDYYQKHADWEFVCNGWLQPFVMAKDLPAWDGDGVIGEIYTEDEASLLEALPFPFVNTSSSDVAHGFPSVCVDNRAIGQLAAEHLIECKLDRFVFIGPDGYRFVKERFKGFSSVVEPSGAKLLSFFTQPSKQTLHMPPEIIPPDRLRDIIAGLEYPVGIMVSGDRVGFSVLQVCRQLGLRSPEDVAVIGVDNVKMYCNMAYSSLTSIDPNAYEVGYQASAMLDRLMNGEELENTRILIPPKGIVFRNSTDLTRSEFPEVARALRFIRNHSSESIDVSNVLDVVSVSRRWLEMKFADEIGHGVFEEIRRVHMERAKELLLSTDWTVLRVARGSGFNTVEQLEYNFQKLFGMSATQYRKSQASQ